MAQLFGEKLRLLRMHTGKTQSETVKEFNKLFDRKMNATTWSGLEHRETAPTVTILRDIAKYFNVTCESLTDHSPANHPIIEAYRNRDLNAAMEILVKGTAMQWGYDGIEGEVFEAYMNDNRKHLLELFIKRIEEE